MTALGYGILAAAIVLCAAAVWCERRKTRRTLEKLNEMLDAAMRGDFTEDSFDETLLSALESKLAHYLAASTVSARNVSTEKEKLKTLIGDISHQTKTPIANILLYAQLLREQPGNVVCLDALDAQTKKLQSLIEALVKTSRLESGVIALRPEPGGASGRSILGGIPAGAEGRGKGHFHHFSSHGCRSGFRRKMDGGSRI